MSAAGTKKTVGSGPGAKPDPYPEPEPLSPLELPPKIELTEDRIRAK